MRRYWQPFTLGFLTFAIAHAIEARLWQAWFGGTYDPWFLNSGRAAAFTLTALVAASAVATSLSKPRILQGVAVAAGAFASMAIMLFVKQSGPGTIVPIVLAAGAILMLLSAAAGLFVGMLFRALVAARP